MGEIADALRRADRGRDKDSTPPRRPPVVEHGSDSADTTSETAPEADSGLRSETPAEQLMSTPAASPATPPAPVRDSIRDLEPPPDDRDAEDPAEKQPGPSPPPLCPPPLSLDPDGDEHWLAARIALSESQGEAAQQYRRLAFRLRDRADARSARSIVVTSAQMGDGKTTTACNLAIQLVKLDQDLRVILVDLDLRRASIASAFDLRVEASIASVLRGEQTLRDAILETNVSGLSMLIQSRPVTDPEWLLAHPNLRSTIRDLEARFDFVIIDTPPVLAVSDAQVVLRHAAAGLFVARAGRTPLKAIRRALEHIPAQKLLGSFLNSSPRSDGTGGYAYYDYRGTRTSEEANPSGTDPSSSKADDAHGE